MPTYEESCVSETTIETMCLCCDQPAIPGDYFCQSCLDEPASGNSFTY